MNYTDKELIRAAQIAYLEINKDVIDDVSESSSSHDYTLFELYNHSQLFRNGIYNEISKAADFTVTESDNRTDVLNRIESDAKRRSVAEKYDIIDDIKTGEIGSWKVVSYAFNCKKRPVNYCGTFSFVILKRRNMLENLVGAPKEHIVLKAFFTESRAFNQVHNRRLNTGEEYHSALRNQLFAVFVQNVYSRDIGCRDTAH